MKMYTNETLTSMNLKTARLVVEGINSKSEVTSAVDCIGFLKGDVLYVHRHKADAPLYFKVHIGDTLENPRPSFLPTEVERVIQLSKVVDWIHPDATDPDFKMEVVYEVPTNFPIGVKGSPLQELSHEEGMFFCSILEFINYEFYRELENNRVENK